MVMNVNIGRLFDGYRDNLDEVVQKLGLELLNKVVLKTPVDTGRARAAWTVGVNKSPPKASGYIPRKSGEQEISTGQPDSGSAHAIAQGEKAILGAEAGDTITLINRLPYILRLEYDGWSTQSPNGMVRISVQEIQEWAERNLGR